MMKNLGTISHEAVKIDQLRVSLHLLHGYDGLGE
jgi:hypothetical protein